MAFVGIRWIAASPSQSLRSDRRCYVGRGQIQTPGKALTIAHWDTGLWVPPSSHYAHTLVSVVKVENQNQEVEDSSVSHMRKIRLTSSWPSLISDPEGSQTA